MTVTIDSSRHSLIEVIDHAGMASGSACELFAFAESIVLESRILVGRDRSIQSIEPRCPESIRTPKVHHAKRHAKYSGAMRCTICQKFLPKAARKGTRFCGTNCRSRAYRLRRDHEESSPGRPPGTPQAPQSLPKTAPPRRRTHGELTIPAVLAHLQQVRERAGLPPLLTDPMLAYQANLDALLTEHMATRRILVSHVTDAEQVIRGSTAWLNDPSTTQVGVGVAPTERGDSVVVILLDRKVAGASALDEHLPVANRAPISRASRHDTPQVSKPPARQGVRLRRALPNPKLKVWTKPEPQAQTAKAEPSDTEAIAATSPALSNKDEPTS